MARAIGLPGLLGVMLLLGSLAVIASVDPVLAAGVLGVLVGLALVLGDVLRRVLARLGLAGMF